MSWMSILLLLFGGAVAWLALRGIRDLIIWIREEFF